MTDSRSTRPPHPLPVVIHDFLKDMVFTNELSPETRHKIATMTRTERNQINEEGFCPRSLTADDMIADFKTYWSPLVVTRLFVKFNDATSLDKFLSSKPTFLHMSTSDIVEEITTGYSPECNLDTFDVLIHHITTITPMLMMYIVREMKHGNTPCHHFSEKIDRLATAMTRKNLKICIRMFEVVDDVREILIQVKKRQI